ncbi:ADP-ribosylation factor-like protein 13B [Macrotis lagotis]|uniref:ADP-ribosylation factor-like protein 13B n=1 Tax=Macrotis lagotis TaxID=92651 RepID=UPI003D69F54E
MSRCFRCLAGHWCCPPWRPARARKVTILMVGLDEAGKTATVKGIQGENPQEVLPTVGFSSLDFQHGNFQVTMLDVGGGQKIRRIWPHYYAETHGIIFVVDSSDTFRFPEVKNTITDVISHPRISGKPLLVLANKQDKEGALGEGEMIESLCLEKLVSEKKCPCQIQSCSAVFGSGKNFDKSILKGLDWILCRIENDFDAINKRVEKDTLLQRTSEGMERQERIERVKQLRREREEEEGDFTTDKITDYGMDVDPFIVSPFRPINEVIMENERKSQGMEMKLGNLLLKTGTEQAEHSETQSQVGTSSQIREGCPFSDSSPGTALPEHMEKENVTEPQKCEKDHLDVPIKESKKRKFKRHHCVTTMNASQSDPQTVKSSPHPLPDLARKESKKSWFRRSNWIVPMNVGDTGTQSVATQPSPLPVGLETSRVTRLPKLEPLAETHHNVQL